MLNNCIKCGKEFKCRPYEAKRRKYCSPECYHEACIGNSPWNKGKIGTVLKPLTGWSIRCIVCGNEKYYQLNEHKKRKRAYCSSKCYHIHSRKDKLSYSAVHSRVIRDWGKADVCDDCGSVKTIDWANISGKYLLVREDWKKLCRKCHIAYDKLKNDLAWKTYGN